MKPENAAALRGVFAGLPFAKIGTTVKEPRLRIAGANGEWIIWVEAGRVERGVAETAAVVRGEICRVYFRVLIRISRRPDWDAFDERLIIYLSDLLSERVPKRYWVNIQERITSIGLPEGERENS